MNLTICLLIGLVAIGSLSNLVKCDETEATSTDSTSSAERIMSSTENSMSSTARSMNHTGTDDGLSTTTISARSNTSEHYNTTPSKPAQSTQLNPVRKNEGEETDTAAEAPAAPAASAAPGLAPQKPADNKTHLASHSNTIHKSDTIILTVHILSAAAYFTSALLLF
ncbi:uncharacterized protein LOC143917004 [Arctopsyche grandis]|uniref:uncharacterized protein LOC143917004 n=1 Tax=Arctopsyche grandis TaxID=121162 RepID=UPI00406D748F